MLNKRPDELVKIVRMRILTYIAESGTATEAVNSA